MFRSPFSYVEDFQKSPKSVIYIIFVMSIDYTGHLMTLVVLTVTLYTFTIEMMYQIAYF